MAEKDLIQELTERIQSHYDREGKPLGFSEYIAQVASDPSPHCRGAAHYIRDTFDFFGSRTIDRPSGKVRRYALFDAAFAGGVGRVAGQEEVQGAIYRLLNNFVREGRVNRLILLHGPNGSAKTTLIRAIIRGMEHYSATPEGALYQFRWVLPSESFVRSNIGFAEKEAVAARVREPDTFARLPGEDIDAVLECDLKDHPLLLIPTPERRRLFEAWQATGKLHPEIPIPDYLLRGDLCAKCRQIHDALMASYGGDTRKMLHHVQVQRLLLSLRYRRGVSTVEPQLHVDASEQQVTASRGLGALPPALAHLALYDFHGPLVDANRGLLEYNDLLKRPIDTFKYLLVTCESGQAALDRSTLFLDSVFIGSTNEMLLDSFKSYADFASFKGRVELVRVPYLRCVSDEVQIYRDQIPEHSLDRHLAPHTLYLASLWAVLTRLRKPETSSFSGELRDVVRSLSPLEKALLFDRNETPARLSATVARELLNAVPALYESPGQDYEGRTGASAREVHMLLLNTAQRGESPCVTPLAVFGEIKALVGDKTVYEFLQRKPEGDFLDLDKILELVEQAYLDRLEGEAAEALGLVSRASYAELFNRYILHVSHWLKKEKLLDPVTGDFLSPDEEMMKEVEGVIRAPDEDAGVLRRNLIARIGAYVLESERSGKPASNPPDYSQVFPSLFERLKEDVMLKHRSTIQRSYQNFLALMDGLELEPRAAELAKHMRDTLISRYGYCDSCAKEAMAFLLQKRYQEKA